MQLPILVWLARNACNVNATLQMPHESFVEQSVDRDVSSPLLPLLNVKLYAKHHSHRKTQTVFPVQLYVRA